MQQRYRLFQRHSGVYYLEDTTTKKQESLKTKDGAEAFGLAAARNQAHVQPALNVAMARTYLLGRSPELVTRTWVDVINDIKKSYHGATAKRWERFARSEPLKSLVRIPLVETEAGHLLAVLRHPRAGTSTNVWLRRLHNYAMDVGWLLSPALPRKVWPRIIHQTRSGITAEEHARIIAQEQNVERRLFYEMLWETGGSQSDIATLRRENIQQEAGLITFHRAKLKGRGMGLAQLLIGARMAAILEKLPKWGLLFPVIGPEFAGHRSTEFKRRCRLAGVVGKSLHSYRYAWAERACEVGMPEREAMAHLGHKSAAIHRAYAKRAKNVTMPLEFYELEHQKKIIKFQAA
jgi:integrase